MLVVRYINIKTKKQQLYCLSGRVFFNNLVLYLYNLKRILLFCLQVPRLYLI